MFTYLEFPILFLVILLLIVQWIHKSTDVALVIMQATYHCTITVWSLAVCRCLLSKLQNNNLACLHNTMLSVH